MMNLSAGHPYPAGRPRKEGDENWLFIIDVGSVLVGELLDVLIFHRSLGEESSLPQEGQVLREV
jgi:hypothetical protein